MGEKNIFEIISGHKKEELINFLSNNPESINQRDIFRETPLHFASSFSTYEIVNILIDSGADINSDDTEQGFTPLFCAVRFKNIDSALEILCRDESILVLNEQGNDKYKRRYNLKLFDKFGNDLLYHLVGVKITEEWDDASENFLEIAEAIYDIKEIQKFNSIFSAIAFGEKEDVVEILKIDRFFDETYGVFYDEGLNPLHIACIVDKYDIVEHFLKIKELKNGIDIESDEYKTPLDYARSEEVKNLLRSHGACTYDDKYLGMISHRMDE